MMRARYARARLRIRRAFTIIEMLVVITIITIIAVVALPRFSTMIYDQEERLAADLLRAAMKTGRDTALRSIGENDAAIVFFYRPGNTRSAIGGRMAMMPCIKVGTFLDDPRRVSPSPVQNNTGVSGVSREIFVPSSSADPIVLPRNWMVRGYAPPNSVQDPQDTSPTSPGANWYENYPGSQRYAYAEGNWVFPETDFYDPTADRAGEYRQTFMVRFKAGSGEVVTTPSNPVIVVDVRPYYGGRAANNTKRLYDSFDRAGFIEKLLREAGPARQLVLGRDNMGEHFASDTVLVRPVQQLALYDENKLATALSRSASQDVRVDAVSGCLYLPPPAVTAAASPANASNLPKFVPNVNVNDVNAWIEGDTNLNGVVNGPGGAVGPGGLDQPLARVFAIDRYTAQLHQLEVQP